MYNICNQEQGWQAIYFFPFSTHMNLFMAPQPEQWTHFSTKIHNDERTFILRNIWMITPSIHDDNFYFQKHLDDHFFNTRWQLLHSETSRSSLLQYMMTTFILRNTWMITSSIHDDNFYTQKHPDHYSFSTWWQRLHL